MNTDLEATAADPATQDAVMPDAAPRARSPKEPLVPTAPALEVVGLSKTFRSSGVGARRAPVHAVRDVSFAIEQGKTLAVVGESGSGKSTVARMILGLEPPTAGTILYAGAERPRRMNSRRRRLHASQVQMVFQNPYRSLDPRQEVGAALSETLRLHTSLDGRGRAMRVVELLDLVGLTVSVLHAVPRQLSGGQRQRICIARALATTPRTLVLDEAVAALDVSVQAQVINVLTDVQRETGVSTLFVTHDLAVVRQVADDVIVMRAGAVVERGDAAAVLDDPQEPYTRLLRESVPREGWAPKASER